MLTINAKAGHEPHFHALQGWTHAPEHGNHEADALCRTLRLGCEFTLPVILFCFFHLPVSWSVRPPAGCRFEIEPRFRAFMSQSGLLGLRLCLRLSGTGQVCRLVLVQDFLHRLVHLWRHLTALSSDPDEKRKNPQTMVDLSAPLSPGIGLPIPLMDRCSHGQ